MNKKKLLGLIAAAATVTGVFSTAAPANAGTFNWGTWTATHTVEDKSTDASGFQSLIPQFQQYVQRERISIPEGELRQLDPNQLNLQYDHNVRVWFLNEGAGFKNQLAYEAVGNTSQSGLIFENASCFNGGGANQACELGSGDGVLDIGDYVDLGTITAGTQLNFFLKADGYRNGTYVYGADKNANPDKLDHLVAYLVNERYLLMGFEDLYGPRDAENAPNQRSDRDFNDLVFVVDFGSANAAELPTSVPEPANMIALLGVGAVGTLQLRRRRQKQGQPSA